MQDRGDGSGGTARHRIESHFLSRSPCLHHQPRTLRLWIVHFWSHRLLRFQGAVLKKPAGQRPEALRRSDMVHKGLPGSLESLPVSTVNGGVIPNPDPAAVSQRGDLINHEDPLAGAFAVS